MDVFTHEKVIVFVSNEIAVIAPPPPPLYFNFVMGVFFLFFRSVGVIVYVMLTGLSPFLDESIDETCANIVHIKYGFPDEHFESVSLEARNFISSILVFDML